MSATSPSVQQQITGLTLPERWVTLDFGIRLCSRYHSERRRFFEWLHTCVAALSAVAGSATVVALMTELPAGREWAIGLAFTIAVMSAVDSVVGFSRRAQVHHDLSREFIALERDFLCSGMTEEDYVRLLARRREIESNEPPTVKALSLRVDRELRVADGRSEDELPAQSWLSARFAHFLS